MTGEPLDLGHGVTATFVHAFDSDQIVGLIAAHNTPQGIRCAGGYVTFADAPNPDGRPVWTVNSTDPLDLSPSVLCRICGHHGWIRNGRWVPA